jgi:hypothetical protein
VPRDQVGIVLRANRRRTELDQIAHHRLDRPPNEKGAHEKKTDVNDLTDPEEVRAGPG